MITSAEIYKAAPLSQRASILYIKILQTYPDPLTWIECLLCAMSSVEDVQITATTKTYLIAPTGNQTQTYLA